MTMTTKTPLRVFGIDLGSSFMPAVRAKLVYAPRDPHARLTVHRPDTHGEVLDGTVVFLLDGKAFEGRIVEWLGGATYRVDLDREEIIHHGVTEVEW